MRQICYTKKYQAAVKGILFLACVFFCPLPCAYSAVETNTDIVTEELAKAQTSWDGSQLPVYPKGVPEVTILRITIPQGAQLPLHKHPVINAGVMLKGELAVITENNKLLRLKEGDAIVEVVDKWHYGKNEGDGPAEIIVFYAGERNSSITVTP
ncbi:MAG: cupin domain-containing protein [Candidatus Omnitrophica bacterium]|nr:cupin domain-containing protein [Candidatus Omnitrophota bacterium]